MFDLIRWWADFLLDRAHFRVVSPERNLLFVVFNLLEIMPIGAIWFVAGGVAPSAKSALYTSFALVTQLQLPHVVGAGTTSP